MTLRVALVCDLAEEHWPSMDLVAEMLALHLPLVAPDVRVQVLRAPMARRATRLPFAGGTRAAYSFDRYSSRYLQYPRWLSGRRSGADVFHVVDHSYAHLVKVLPAERTVVTCHDIDAFRCLTEPGGGGLYGLVARRVLEGLRRAAVVTCDTRATRDELVAHRLAEPDRLQVVPNGVHPAFTSGIDPFARDEAARLLGPPGLELLHVGSAIPRKRIDLLLRTFEQVRQAYPGMRLVRAGGALTAEQRVLARSLKVDDAIAELPFLAPDVLAAVYERAALTLLPSDLEGFGLPVLESLACGTPVLASRIAALMEVGSGVVAYADPGNAASWSSEIAKLLDERQREPGRWGQRVAEGQRHARSFCWSTYAAAMAELYRRIANLRGRSLAS